MANPRNEASVKELHALLDDAKTFFLVDYQGLSAGELGRLRAAVKQVGGRILVAKNTLIDVVLKEQGVEGLADSLVGPTALVLVGEDPVAPLKAIADFAKEHPKDLPVGKGGLLQGGVVTADALSRIASLPSRQQLQSELLGTLLAPLRQLVGVLEGPQRNLVGVMHNYSETLKEKEA
ncbi:MAG TPA: 50S ribosomal protein L10 [Trueperaceae bacterium]|nr:50S ribosomal protein L10 [Trueperaceae bacterium]